MDTDSQLTTLDSYDAQLHCLAKWEIAVFINQSPKHAKLREIYNTAHSVILVLDTVKDHSRGDIVYGYRS